MTRSTRSRRGLWPIWQAIAVVLAIGLLVAGATGVLMWVGLRRATGWNASTQLEVIRNALIVTGGIGGIVALVVAYRKQHIAEDAHTREDDRLFNERFMSACAALGHDSAAVRLAAVAALARLADDWEPQRQTCIDVLCSYIRLPYEPDETQDRWRYGEQEVRWSIIRTIRDHLRLDEDGRRSWRGRDFDFTGAVFDGGDFSEAMFSGRVSFNDAKFVGGSVWFDAVTFSSSITAFYGATFSGGIVSFKKATFAFGSLALFSKATFSGGRVLFEQTNVLGNLYFDGARFTGGAVEFQPAILERLSVLFDDDVLSSPPEGLALPDRWSSPEHKRTPLTSVDLPVRTGSDSGDGGRHQV